MEKQKQETLVFGYIRSIEIELQLVIPHDITIIISYYLIKYLIYGIGQFGIFGNDLGDLTKWKQLTEWEDIVDSINNIYIGFKNVMIITSKKQIFVAGDNSQMQLGIKEPAQINTFTEFKLNNNIKPKFVSTLNHTNSFVLSTNNLLYINGNIDKSLSKKDTNCKIMYKMDDILSIKHNNEYFIDIQCLNKRSIFLSSIGNVYSYGNNNYEICGLSQPTFIKKPVLIPIKNNERIIKMRIGVHHTILIDKKNQIHYFGKNTYGQFGTDNGNLHVYQPSIHQYFQSNNIKIVNIECQVYSSFFIDENGGVYCCGFNRLGNLGIGTTSVTENKIHRPIFANINVYIVDQSCGVIHTALLSNNNDLICFGYNNKNQCSVSKSQNKISIPHAVSKSKELNILETDYIEKVFASQDRTIIVVNPIRKMK